MNWNQLQYVITIAEEKSITKAAKKLFISQPSLSLSIQSLEKETGITLFERNHGEITLTYAGSLFYEWAVSTLHSHKQLTTKLNDLVADRRHLIRFGISPHRSLLLLPEILKQFYQDFPDCEIQLTESPTFQLKKMLENNELDFMVDIPNPDTLNYQNDVLIEEKILLAVPASFKHSSSIKTINLAELSDYPFILLPPDHVIGSISRKICETASFHPDVRLTCRKLDMALALVSSQLGAAFVPEIYAKKHLYEPQVQYFFIEHFTGTRQICLVYRKNVYQPFPLRHLLQLFRDMLPVLYMLQ
ncbi:MAG: LysR family transcriptional regulator [Lachnospiraceae bacterium]|nr:LysR family transcriptional regulator [Lachnospiraceae bacterium]